MALQDNFNNNIKEHWIRDHHDNYVTMQVDGGSITKDIETCNYEHMGINVTDRCGLTHATNHL